MSRKSSRRVDAELARRISAAYISYVSGLKGVDRTLKQLANHPVGDFWLEVAARIVEAHKTMSSENGTTH